MPSENFEDLMRIFFQLLFHIGFSLICSQGFLIRVYLLFLCWLSPNRVFVASALLHQQYLSSVLCFSGILKGLCCPKKKNGNGDKRFGLNPVSCVLFERPSGEVLLWTVTWPHACRPSKAICRPVFKWV